jgi:hypothetical protein
MVKKLILPVVMLIGGGGAGAAAGLLLLPPSTPAETEPVVCAEPVAADDMIGTLPDAAPFDTPSAFVPINNQFIVPILEDGDVTSLVILSLSLEIPEGQEDPVLAAEPRLRDGFLQVLFDHANTGGFDGSFTATEPMRSLRLSLDNVAKTVLGDLSRNVLIVDILRQDV